MSSRIYNWKRFWCPREGNIYLIDGGYLYDPNSEWGAIYNPDVVALESIVRIPCLGLLGEPGIGKTHAMQADREAIETRIKEEGGETLWIDLRSYASEDRLCRDLFESKSFASWMKGKHKLHVFLDSLDECLLRIDTIAALLIDEFKKCPVERLCVRIACRTADWPKGLEEGLVQLWGNDGFTVYELAPLRRVDVEHAAMISDVDPEAFLREINHMEAVPLAIKPVTLGFLLNTYQRAGQFPSTQTELYLQGCRLLCEETSESRRDGRLIGNLTAQQRMIVAARIAAVTVFANRYAVWTSVDRGDVPYEDVTLQKLCGGTEEVNGVHFEVSEAALREALATGLFSSRGPNRAGWAHQTYAEFLASRYLVDHQMTLTQMMSLLIHPGDPGGRLVPQLHESSAWLAGMVPDVFREIMRADPEVLLRSDVATADVQDRAALVESLLRLYDEETLLDRDLGIRERYRKLAHPGLAEQLRPYICGRSKGIIVRRVATDIAEACELQSVQHDLVEIALDPSEPLPIRVNCAYALVRIGGDETKKKLKPLAIGEAGDDPNDELRGCGLLAIWPAHITAEELFAVLIPPKRQSFVGSYQAFIFEDIAKHLQPSDLPVGLKWVEAQKPRRMMPYPFRRLADAIMLQAWEHLEFPGILDTFAKAAISLLEQRDEIVGDDVKPPFREVLTNDDEKRRRVVETALPLLTGPAKDPIWLVFSQTPLVLRKDVPWLIELFRRAQSEDTQRLLAQLINRAFDWREPGQIDGILVACQDSSILAESFEWLLKPIDTDSPEAHKMKENYLRIQELEEQHRKRPLVDPPPKERIATLLGQCEVGNLAAWWDLNLEMTLEVDSTHYGIDLESDLTVLPGWKTADDSTKARIIQAAEKYVLDQDPETREWLGTKVFYRPAMAGFRALRLLLKEAPGFISTIPSDVWKKWAPTILVYPTSSGIEDQEPHRELVKIAYQYATAEIIETLLLLIDKENADHNHIFITSMMEGCWDMRLANALVAKVKSGELKPESMGCLLSDLIDHRISESREFAEALISLPLPPAGDRRSRAVIAARVLMTHAQDAGWSAVWPAIQYDQEFARELIKAVAHSPGRQTVSVGQVLTEDQLMELYIWLVRQYPYSEDPQRDGADYVQPRESVGYWRDTVLGNLKERGTTQACEAIRKIVHELPGLDWMKWTLLEAQSITRRRTWVPPRPDDILKIASNKQGRLVQGGDQLLEVLVESLRRLEAKLQGETPAAIDLWNEIRKNVYKPKDENRLSDYVKRHLDDDLSERGVIINREVEIRRGEGSAQGERTDIRVDAVVRNSQGEVYDSITAIIEVKGCWNLELNHAMKTQLADRYLKDNRCQHGLYVVGWFNCQQWDNEDYRNKQAPKLDINEAQKQFDAQAAELTRQGASIKAIVVNTALR